MGALAVVPAAVLVGLPLLWLRALVLLAYVEWFVRPMFPAFPVVPVASAMGLLMLPAVVAPRKKTEADDDGPWVTLAKSVAASLSTLGLAWVCGWLVALLGRL
jgi:putative effector of murein hydrolase LrgA (UPF0299 family)